MSDLDDPDLPPASPGMMFPWYRNLGGNPMKQTIAMTLVVAFATVHAASPATVANAPGVNTASSRCQGAPPDSVKAAVILGDCLREEKNDRAAVEAYRRGLATDPHGSRDLFLGMALAYDALKQYDLELQSAFSADHLAPSDPEVLYQTGIAYENLEEWPEAIDYFNKTLAVRPNDGRAHRNIGFVLLQQDKPEEAIRHLETAVGIDQNDWKAHLSLSAAYAASFKDLNRELQRFPVNPRRDAQSTDQRVQRHNEIAARLQAIDYNAKSDEHAREAARLKPDEYRTWYSLGMGLMRNPKTLPEAIDAFEHAIAINPDYYPLLRNMAIAQDTAHRPADAYETCKHLLTLAPDDKDMLLMAAHIAGRLGRLDEAAKGYRELLRLGDQNWMTPVELAGVLRRQGRNDEAMQELDKLKAARPEIAKMIDSYFAHL